MIKIQHFENGIFEVKNSEIIDFTQKIFAENEENDSHLIKPKTEKDAIKYIDEYCDNLQILK